MHACYDIPTGTRHTRRMSVVSTAKQPLFGNVPEEQAAAQGKMCLRNIGEKQAQTAQSIEEKHKVPRAGLNFSPPMISIVNKMSMLILQICVDLDLNPTNVKAQDSDDRQE